MSNETINAENTNDYSTLMLVGNLNSFLGWLMVAACGVAIVVGLAGDGAVLAAVVGVMFIPISLLVVASGQMISCFVSTERNSHQTSNELRLIRDILSNDKTTTQEIDTATLEKTKESELENAIIEENLQNGSEISELDGNPSVAQLQKSLLTNFASGTMKEYNINTGDLTSIMEKYNLKYSR